MTTRSATFARVLALAAACALVGLAGCGRRPAPAALEAPAAASPRADAPAVTLNDKAAEAPAAERATGVTEESEPTSEPQAGRSPIATAVAAETPAPAT